MEKYDTIIVGAGTAGLSAGMELHKHGMDYLLIDRKPEIGKPIRSTGGISMHFVERLGMPDNKEVTAAHISSIKLAGDNKDYSMDFGHPVGIVYNFEKYEKYMAKDLNIELNDPVESAKDGVLKTQSHEYKYKNIIYAAGPHSKFKPKWYNASKSDTIIGYEETRKVTDKPDVDLTLYFSKYSEGGYIWDFPDSGNLRKIGIGIPVTNNEDPREQLSKFTEIHKELEGDIDHKIAHQIPVGEPSAIVVDGNTAYIGDIAGTCFADTGGGLQGAFWSGKLAAGAIVKGNIGYYQKEWNDELYPLLERHYKIKKIMYKIGTSKIETLFGAMNGFQIKSENATREIPRLLMHIARKKPSLFPLFISAMF